jgi:murein DD-endopeptidase MepM/ murein hydrolase activator NlpD
MKRFPIFPFCLLLFYFTQAQEYNFISPIDTEIRLAANFGELRDNHFHSGLDILTGGKEGWEVHAVEDGYVSRILMSRKGYGNALYIAHPNGITSVYGHLSKFNDSIASFARTIQYAHEEFELDTILLPGTLKVTKGEIIALSGNTGGSTGPHLHFELRNSFTELALNPENYGFQVRDIISPKLYSISVFNLNGVQSKYVQTLSMVSNKTFIVSPGKVGLGVTGIDYYSDYQFNAGLYDTRLYADDSLIFEKRMDSFSFDNWRCINQHLDYAVLKTKGIAVEKCFLDDGNKAEVYYNLSDKGVIQLNPGEEKKIRIVVSDHAGNSTAVSFILKGAADKTAPTPVYNFSPTVWDTLLAKRARLYIQPGAFYDTCFLNFYADTTLKKYSYRYYLGNTAIPVQKEIELQISPLYIPRNGASKLYIRSIANGSIGGSFSNGTVNAKTRICGIYFIDVDTLKPGITPVNIAASRNIRYNSTLKFTIYDAQTGIKNYHAMLDGQFILFSYDLKYNQITWEIPPDLSQGTHTFELSVTDYYNNTNHYKTTLYR